MAQLQGDIGGLADELERQIAEQAQASAATGLEGASFVFPAGPTIPSPSPQAPPVPNPEPEPEPTDEKPTLEEIYNEYQVTDTDEMVSYPPWPVSEFVDPKSVTKEEARLLNEMAFGSLFLGKPEKLLAFYDIYDDALNRANATVPAPTSTDNHTDAFRHAYWSARLCQEYGPSWAEDYATAHEMRPNDTPAAEAMDLYNNEVGRRIYAEHPDATPDELATYIQEALDNGELLVIDANGNLAWSNEVGINDTGHPNSVPNGPAGTEPNWYD